MEDDAQDNHGTDLDPTGRRRGTARRVGQVLACGWCRTAITVRSTGRTPKWCSRSCRQRAWEQARAAASGRAAVEVVDRQVEIEVRVPVKVLERVEVPVHPRGGPAWDTALRDLATQLDNGGIADRDIPALLVSLERVTDSLRRRPAFHLYYRLNWPPSS